PLLLLAYSSSCLLLPTYFSSYLLLLTADDHDGGLRGLDDLVGHRSEEHAAESAAPPAADDEHRGVLGLTHEDLRRRTPHDPDVHVDVRVALAQVLDALLDHPPVPALHLLPCRRPGGGDDLAVDDLRIPARHRPDRSTAQVGHPERPLRRHPGPVAAIEPEDDRTVDVGAATLGHDHDRAAGVQRDGQRRPAEEDALQPADAARPDDDEVGVL